MINSTPNVNDVINYIDELIVIFDANGIIEKMNCLCDDILPFNHKDAVGKSIYAICKNGLVKDPIMIQMLKLKKKIYRNIKYPTGKVIAYTASPMFTSNGILKGGVLTGRDISRLEHLPFQLNSTQSFKIDGPYISRSFAMENIKNIALRASQSDSSIFINGESGVGKEIIARMIYKNSPRKDMPFVSINCSAIPSELLESEFFGYEEFSFTGAKKGGKNGLLEKANNGTLFLDEIGELPLSMQSKLLRVIQENEFLKVGGTVPIKVNIRYISATNLPLTELHKGDIFRQDLYYRLNVIPIKIPPLRDRKEDIKPLILYFLKIFNEKYNRNLCISNTGISKLSSYHWPGNIRELKNIIERFVVLSTSSLLTELDIENFMSLDNNTNSPINPIVSQDSISLSNYSNLNEVHSIIDQIMITNAIKETGSIVKAAKLLGINPSTIHRKIKSGLITLS